MGTHPIFESDFDCLTDMKLGALFSAAVSAQNAGPSFGTTRMPSMGTAAPTRKPEYVYTTFKPARPSSPKPTMDHHTGSPHTGSPHQMPEEGGCNERSMMVWRAAMKQWK